jgi:hypothetical protein
MDPTACDKYDLPETNLRMCTRSPNIYGHDTSQPRTLEPQGLMKRRSLSKQKDSDSSSSSSSSSSDESDTNNKANKQRVKKLRRKRKCMQICLILVALVVVLMVTNTVSLIPPSKPLMTYMPSWNNYT